MLADGAGGLRRRFADDSVVVVVTAHPFAWPSLDVNGRRVQSRARTLYNEYFALLHAVLRHESADAGDGSVTAAHARITEYIERRDTSHQTAAAALAKVKACVERQLDALDAVHSDHEELLVVPDTNALYWNPRLEDWRAPDGQPFTMVLIPHVLTELDQHKAATKDTSRKQKAEQLIRQIGEYRRRAYQGGTTIVQGVPLHRGVSRILAATVNPGFDELPKWLSGVNVDQWFFASVLAVMRLNPRAPTAIVTRDVNLQNIIDVAGLTMWSPDLLVDAAPSRPNKRTRNS